MGANLNLSTFSGRISWTLSLLKNEANFTTANDICCWSDMSFTTWSKLGNEHFICGQEISPSQHKGGEPICWGESFHVVSFNVFLQNKRNMLNILTLYGCYDSCCGYISNPKTTVDERGDKFSSLSFFSCYFFSVFFCEIKETCWIYWRFMGFCDSRCGYISNQKQLLMR